MSMDALDILKEQEKKQSNRLVEGGPDLEGMELGNEGNLDDELGLDDGGNEGDDEHVVIKDADVGSMRSRYAIDGQPDYFNMRTYPARSLRENDITRTENDWYLREGGYQPIEFFGISQKFLENKYKGYAIVSAYDKATHKYDPVAELHRPLHAMTEGGKGIAMYTRPVIYLSADMSTINNFNITFGCPSNCSFCKESILGRGYTQLSVDEKSGIIRVEMNNEKDPSNPISFTVPSKSRVKFFDPKVDAVVFGPISIAVVNGFPIATDSLEKLRSGQLTRLVSD